MFDALSQHHVMKDLATSLANKSRCLKQTASLHSQDGQGMGAIIRLICDISRKASQRLHMAVMLMIGVESRTQCGADLAVDGPTPMLTVSPKILKRMLIGTRHLRHSRGSGGDCHLIPLV